MNNSWISIYLLIPGIAWLVAQILKAVFELSKPKEGRNRRVLRSGGMPSAHSATIAALLTVVAVAQGIGSPLFGVVGVMAAIVLYDAVNVRRSVGEQGDVLRAVATATKTKHSFFVAYGHNISEIIVGFFIGAAVAYGLLQIL